MRQMHHWACDIFVGSIVVHMARVFFTGAFRKPRELNWTIGLTMLILAIGNGFLGYSLPDDLVSGTGIRIAYSIVLSIPVVGTYLAFFVFGGNFPGTATIPRFFILHVLILPLIIIGLVTAHLILVGAPEAHPVPRRGSHREERGGLADVPGLHGEDHRLPLHHRAGSRRCSRPSPRSTPSGSSARTRRLASPTPSSPTGTWASSTARCASSRRGRSWPSAIRSRSRSSSPR